MSDEAKHRELTRRALMKSAGVVAGGALAAGVAAKLLHDPDGEAGKPKKRELVLPAGGFAVEPSAVLPALGVAHGVDVPKLVRAAIDAVGGIQRFVKNGDVVVVKPNVAFERSAALGATTNPDVLRAVVHLCREAGAKEVRVADNPIESPEACFVRSGIHRAAAESGASIHLPVARDFETLHVPGAKWIERWPFFWRPFVGANKVIGVAPVKDHNLCRASMTTKNWYGLLGGRRNQFHQDIHGIIADLALMLRPTLVLLDGTRVLHRSGPTGGSLSDVRMGNTVVASTDSLAADAYGWHELLERRGEALPGYFEQAAVRGLGNPDWKSQVVKKVQAG
ncbi:DUF362 domain-containing protein [Myxococcota bacterium]|nr:DUF362 domain-containing protein [Myxococcota bacterium]